MRGLIYLIVILFATGCSFSKQHPRAFDEAESLMHSDPAAALSTLTALDVSEFQDSATLAQWALLYSEALVVNRLAAPTDTIVNLAVDYYGRHNFAEEFRKASELKALLQQADDTDALATALYIQKEKEVLLYKEKAKRRLEISLLITTLIIACGFIIWLRQRLKLQCAQNDALMAEASGLRSSIDASRGDVGRLESKLNNLLESRFALIDSLCQTYYESQGTKTERKAIVDKVKSEIEAARTDSLQEMEQAVNDCRNNLIATVRSNCPTLKTNDLQLLVYLASGLSTRTISLLLGESIEVIYKRKSRLKSRLKAAVEPLRPDVMSIF
ncbi:MAG: hypothetical protein K2L05_00430 [Muribaculaceae bacterium]|nr:hypothetical protein [Muribaculaceae bacterium]